MIRNLKTVGVVVAAVFALTAIGASAAYAEFTAGSTTGNITAVQTTTHNLTTSSGTVTCATAHFTGTLTSAASTSMTLTPKYEACKAFGFIGVPIDVNGCSYEFTAHTSGEIHVKCPAGKEIEITTPGCTTKIGPQTFKGSTYTNTTNSATGKMDILIHTDATFTLAYNECGTVRTNGSYTGTTTVTATDTNGNPLDVTVDTP